MNRAWISLGANLGDPLRNLKRALDFLSGDGEIFLDARSPFYRTQAVNFTDQPNFINLCARVLTTQSPKNFFLRLLAIQKELGQGAKEIPFGPRFMDLDLLLYEDLVLDSEFLIVPHPRMHLRRFVLRPLCDFDPDLIHPVCGLSMLQLLEKIPAGTQAVERIP